MARDVTSVGDRITALASAGTLYLLSNQNEILTRSGCGSIAVDPADGHTENAHVVAGEDAVAVLEVRDNVRAVDGVAGPKQHDHAGDEQHDKRRRRPSSCECGSLSALRGRGRGTSPGAGTSTGLGVGSGVDSSPGGGSAGGPGGGPPGGGAGSGSR